MKQNWHIIKSLLKHKILVPEEVQIEAIKINRKTFEYLDRYRVKLSKEVLKEAGVSPIQEFY